MSVIVHCDKCGANKLDSCHCVCNMNISSLSDELKACHERHIELAAENVKLRDEFLRMARNNEILCNERDRLKNLVADQAKATAALEGTGER